MSSPPTFDDVRALCQRVSDGVQPPSDVLAVLDADYFAGCDVLDLDQEHVETIVRWAIREALAGWVWPGIRCGGFSADDPMDFAARVSNGPIVGNVYQRELVRRAMGEVMDQLRDVNGQEEDQ